jgi:hypothetical protein
MESIRVVEKSSFASMALKRCSAAKVEGIVWDEGDRMVEVGRGRTGTLLVEDKVVELL